MTISNQAKMEPVCSMSAMVRAGRFCYAMEFYAKAKCGSTLGGHWLCVLRLHIGTILGMIEAFQQMRQVLIENSSLNLLS